MICDILYKLLKIKNKIILQEPITFIAAIKQAPAKAIKFEAGGEAEIVLVAPLSERAEIMKLLIVDEELLRVTVEVERES